MQQHNTLRHGFADWQKYAQADLDRKRPTRSSAFEQRLYMVKRASKRRFYHTKTATLLMGWAADASRICLDIHKNS
ncbi:hypothetical protein PABG_02050 [Paracoccidioides brasiliensis Pb03]|nr:hypothetical protein PABG_02050 [Paracoccidioides brasiliensis Pb03]